MKLFDSPTRTAWNWLARCGIQSLGRMTMTTQQRGLWSWNVASRMLTLAEQRSSPFARPLRNFAGKHREAGNAAVAGEGRVAGGEELARRTAEGARVRVISNPICGLLPI